MISIIFNQLIWIKTREKLKYSNTPTSVDLRGNQLTCSDLEFNHCLLLILQFIRKKINLCLIFFRHLRIDSILHNEWFSIATKARLYNSITFLCFSNFAQLCSKVLGRLSSLSSNSSSNAVFSMNFLIQIFAWMNHGIFYPFIAILISKKVKDIFFFRYFYSHTPLSSSIIFCELLTQYLNV